jgi:acetamidase/formamidase
MNLTDHHRVALDTFHYRWSRFHKPALSIEDGDTVTFEINDVSSWQFNERSKHADVMTFDWTKLDPLAGPVSIEGGRHAPIASGRLAVRTRRPLSRT